MTSLNWKLQLLHSCQGQGQRYTNTNANLNGTGKSIQNGKEIKKPGVILQYNTVKKDVDYSDQIVS